MRISGTVQQASPPNYTFVQLALQLVPGGSGPLTPTTGVDISPYAMDQVLRFSYRSGLAGVTYTVSLVSANVADLGYFSYTWVASDTNWRAMAVYFPGAAASPQFTQPAWAAPELWANTVVQVGAVLFGVSGTTTANIPYDLSVDDVRFDEGGGLWPKNTPTPLPLATPQPVAPGSGDSYVAPNPVRDGRCDLVYEMAKPGTARIRLFQASGDQVGRASFVNGGSGTMRSPLDLRAYAPGIYFYILELAYDDGNKEKLPLRKFIVTK